jgi:fructose-specific phosphotransferase system IIC component
MTFRCYRRVMLAVDFTSDVLPFVVFGGIALVVVVWLVITRVFTKSRAGRHAAHFLDVGGADMSPEDRVKYKNQHPGAGGYG